MRSLKTYIDILQKKGLRYSIQEGWRAIWPIWWTSNQSIKNRIHQERTYQYLLRHYVPYITSQPNPQGNVPKIIWICWLQGMDTAPKTVQLCYESVQRWAKGFDIRLLTAENMLQYVSLPNDIINKYQSGRIPFAQFSDILRVSLLAEHGGIWMDATVMMTGEMPKYVTEGDLFMYRESWLQSSRSLASNWFLASTQGHPIMRNMQQLLIAYWQHEHYLRDYFIFHILLYILVRNNAQCKQLFNRMHYVSNADVHAMQFRAANEPYSELLKQDILQNSTIHKLSHKNAVDYHLYIQ